MSAWIRPGRLGNRLLRGLLLGPLLILLAATTATALEREALREALESIRPERLKAHVEVLADDSFEGREAGSRGGRAASMYLLRHFEQLELAGGGDDGGYFQSFSNGYRNVLGLIEGSDPQLKHQTVVIGAHYDHVGYGSQQNSYGPIGYIHNGADDNASGIAGLLEIARAFSRLPTAPKRSILFAFWDGEEKGLLGSRHWVHHPTRKLADVVLMVNMDMIGRLRNDRLEVFGTRSSYGLRRLVSQQNSQQNPTSGGLDIDFSWEIKSNSDHYPFYERGVPVLMLHTGLHDDYHRPSDHAHKINADGMQQVSRLAFQAVAELANRPQVPPFRTASRSESPSTRKQLERPLPRATPRLGVGWKAVETEAAEGPSSAGEPHSTVQLVLTHVLPDSAAERAGLRAGDRLVRFAGQPIADENRLRIDILAARNPVQFEVQRPGQQERLSVPIQLAGKPVRIGFSWREDSAEPGTAVITRVIPGSAAHQARLRVADRVYQVAGKPFHDSDHLLRLLTTLPGPLELLIERRGKLQTVVLPVRPAGDSARQGRGLNGAERWGSPSFAGLKWSGGAVRLSFEKGKFH